MEGVGIGRAALELATKYANERVVFDRPIGKNQAVAHPLADSWIRLEAAELMAMKAAALLRRRTSRAARGRTPPSSSAPRPASRRATGRCQTLGGYAYAKEYHVERLWREVAAAPHRAVLPGDGAQLHLHRGPRPAEVVLMSTLDQGLPTRLLEKQP